MMKNLKMTLVNRKERWREFQRCISARARVQFFYLLSERGFRGRLLADHKGKQLDLNVGRWLSSEYEGCSTNFRLNLTKLGRAEAAKPRLSREGKNHFPPSAYCCPYGTLWVRLFVALMNCEIFDVAKWRDADWFQRRLHGQCESGCEYENDGRKLEESSYIDLWLTILSRLSPPDALSASSSSWLPPSLWEMYRWSLMLK